MNSPTDVPSESPRAFVLPSDDNVPTRGRTAVIIGAGPGGLMASVTLLDAGYDSVTVVEGRETFSRHNVVNLHPESMHLLKRLDILDAFKQRASELVEHRNDIFAGGEKIYHDLDVAFDEPIDPQRTFDPCDVATGFVNETLYSVTIADLQDLLLQVARSRGVRVLAQASAHLTASDNAMYSVSVRSKRDARVQADFVPDLIVVADGSSSSTYRALDGRYIKHESLWDGEAWVFGNYSCRPRYGASRLLFEFCDNYDHLTISNCIFIPHYDAVNVAVTVGEPAPNPAAIRELVARQAIKVLDVCGLASTGGRITWHSDRPVRIVPKTAVRSHFGQNVVLVGDVNGSNSPVAALGATLCTSAYSYALRTLVSEFESLGRERALAAYDERVAAYVKRWHSKVSEVRGAINIDMRHKTARTALNGGVLPPILSQGA